MNADETRRAAQVMLDSLKPGAVVEVRLKDVPHDRWDQSVMTQPAWDWEQCDYRIAEPKHTKIAELPPVCWVREIGSRKAFQVWAIDESDLTLTYGAGWVKLETFLGTYEYSPDRINWTPFV